MIRSCGCGDEPALLLHGLCKRFGDTVAVEDLSLEVPRGVVYGLLGPNGAGKTTTLRMAVGIVAPDRGSVRCLGVPMGSCIQQRLGYLPEERGLYPGMRVAEQLEFFAALRGVDRRRLATHVAEYLGMLGLSRVGRSRVDELSHGMRQLLQVAVALVHEPDVVVMDEPFTGLDPVHTERLMMLIRELRQRGVAVVLSTHAMEQAEQVCDWVALMRHGRLLSHGRVEEVRSSVKTRVLRLVFDGVVPEIEALPEGLRVRVDGATVSLDWPDPRFPHELVNRLAGRGRIVEVEFQPPRLRELFMEVAR